MGVGDDAEDGVVARAPVKHPAIAEGARGAGIKVIAHKQSQWSGVPRALEAGSGIHRVAGLSWPAGCRVGGRRRRLGRRRHRPKNPGSERFGRRPEEELRKAQAETEHNSILSDVTR